MLDIGLVLPYNVRKNTEKERICSGVTLLDLRLS